jgi:hypothetical protein
MYEVKRFFYDVAGLIGGLVVVAVAVAIIGLLGG